ncbi:restriction endonuclease subunit S [Oenococcus oeni]|uniref:restriction endonuclease subunit S n=1 Tax=Oenococcus oeni TaxID=1247 RepID=UPI00295400B4|nr:restriction endonuclease subunit S [Oenococcus oeni]
MAEKAREYPELRFQGFSGAWEKRKLGDVSDIQGGGTPDSKNQAYWSGDINWFTPTEVFNQGYLSESRRKITKEGLLKSSATLMPPGTVLMTSRAGVGDMGILTQAAATNQGFQSMIPHKEMPSYLLYSMQFFISRMANKLASGSTFMEISGKQLAKIEVMIPGDSQERELLCNFFKNLDDMITVNQRKLNELKKLKKAYLQKMFPKNGVSIPELRFAGFTTPWEKRKSKSLFQSIVEKGKSNLPVLSVTQDSGVVFRDEIDINIKYDHSTLDSYKVVHPGDFVISLRSFQGGFELSNKLGITSPAYTIFISRDPSKQSNLFWEVQFKSYRFVESLKTVTFGVRDGKSISFKEFSDLKLLYPIDIKEQIQIGTFFKSLDDLITVNQRKLDKLKELKKGYLQKMFI